MSEMQNCLNALKSIVPHLSHAGHKGTAGRIGVIGGSLEYTGAPYFSAISAMKAGADLGHVFCIEEAGPVIKSYSPELIVHPLLSSRRPVSDVVASVTPWFPRLHALIVGPGLGRDPATLDLVKVLIVEAKKQNKDIVIDADGLFLVTNHPEIISGYSNAILTPNAGEFPRLYEKVLGTPPNVDDDITEQTKILANKMGKLTILRKGANDIISNGDQVIQCTEKGCMRRCGGQGDIVSGLIGLFSFWARQSESRLLTDYNLPPPMVAAFGGCFLTKVCAEAAFQKHHRAMLAGDLVNEISAAFYNHLEPK